MNKSIYSEYVRNKELLFYFLSLMCFFLPYITLASQNTKYIYHLSETELTSAALNFIYNYILNA